MTMEFRERLAGHRDQAEHELVTGAAACAVAAKMMALDVERGAAKMSAHDRDVLAGAAERFAHAAAMLLAAADRTSVARADSLVARDQRNGRDIIPEATGAGGVS